MRFTGDSWVEVRQVGGGLLVGDLKRDGEVIDLEGDGPFNILVGSVVATQVIFDGELIDLSSQSSNNVARITLP